MNRYTLRYLSATLLLLAVASVAYAERDDCPVYAATPGATNREYGSCAECLEHHERCEERCGGANGYICVAEGYDHNDEMHLVEGRTEESERQAKRSAIRQCQDRGLQDCSVGRCANSVGGGRGEARPCEGGAGRNPVLPHDDDNRGGRRNRREPEPPAPQPTPQPANPKCVVSWQHVKERCESRPYDKILKNCNGHQNFWQGIHCKVTWGDGRTEDVHGKVDLTDACGKQYCTRASRPANFNCVTQCDDTPGPLMTVPR